MQYDPELHQHADNPESPLKAEQTPVEPPVYAEHEELGVTQPPFPLNRQPFKNVSQSESYVIPEVACEHNFSVHAPDVDTIFQHLAF